MSKIWIFGDSYGTHLANNNQKITPWFWAYSLGKRLNCTEYKNFSQWGVGNDYIHHEIDLHAEEISPQDYVIVITSSSSREWLIEEQPTFSNFEVLFKICKIFSFCILDKEEKVLLRKE